MALNGTLLRSSFQLALERNPQITARFYRILFDKYPQVIPMFRPDRQARQEQMLAQALVAVVEHIDDAPWLASTLSALGSKHVGYGVTAEMYDWVGDALLTALGEAAGSDWLTEHREAWAEAYGAIVSMMRAGESAGVAAE